MDRPLRIIGSYVSPYVRKVLACLNLKGLAYEIDPITPFFGSDEFERLSPLRRIPIVVDGAFSVGDSTVICAYLDDAYPRPAVVPLDPRDRARARWFEEFADTRLGDLFIWGLYEKVVSPAVWGEPGDEQRIARTLNEDLPRTLDYLEGELPADGYLVRRDRRCRHFDREVLPQRRLCRFRGRPSALAAHGRVRRRTLDHPCIAALLPFEDVQRSAEIKHRRQALIDAGAPLTEETLGIREPRRGDMRL